ncbi:MAG TPA: FAD-dependent oxidoreductase [Parafilimonas sp.]|nr:FAD-dependent oxidoreductase [Parafilimonas sp.]
MPEPWRKGKFIRIEKMTEATWRFWIEIPELEKFDFKPGQFVTLDLPIHEKPNKRWRSYSIASHPDGTNIIELVIVLLEGGLGTHYLFNHVEVGTEVPVRGPQGVFTLPEAIDKDLFFICTGTGIAPFRSMVNHIKRHNIGHKNIYLIFGCRKLCDSLYGEEMKRLSETLENFYYIPTYSREDRENGAIKHGYVHAVYQGILTEQKPEANFYLCGWKEMIDDAKKNIITIGYDKKSIHLELYG